MKWKEKMYTTRCILLYTKFGIQSVCLESQIYVLIGDWDTAGLMKRDSKRDGHFF